MLKLWVQDGAGRVLASSAGERETLLCVDRRYAPGDALCLESDAAHVRLQLDAALPEGEVYLPGGRLTWPVPVGEDRSAYCPALFEAARHILSARALGAAERAAYRNLACNPADVRGETSAYPHCTANVETRNEACFCARNVIDGLRLSGGHGEWPYQSWGIGARADAWCLLDLGREADVDAMALTLRADFPHDAYWTRGHVALSDGTAVAFDLAKSGLRQWIPLGRHRVRTLRLERLEKSDDPSSFPALIEWEVFGREAECPWQAQPGERGDIRPWMALVEALRDSFPGLETPEALAEHQATVLRFMDKGQALCIKDGQRLVGAALFSRGRNQLCFLGVAAPYRRRGVGGALLGAALAQLDPARPVTVITFRAEDAKGPGPRALYQRFGFAPGALTEAYGYPLQEFVLPPRA